MAIEKKYKIKHLKFFSSREYLYQGKRIYRKVFERNEISYLYFEVAFYNLSNETWNAKVRFVVEKEQLIGDKEITNVSEEKEISPADNLVRVTSSWGEDEEGSFWEEGVYVLSVFINDELVQKREKIFIYNYGLVTKVFNPYFDIPSVKLFEGPYNPQKKSERKYCYHFDRKKTRYLWFEIIIKNKIKANWKAEIKIRIITERGEEKAILTYEDIIKKSEYRKTVEILKGWGNDSGGSWKSDKYYYFIDFMGTVIATGAFTVGKGFKQGLPLNLDSTSNTNIKDSIADSVEEETLDDLIAKLDELIGLEKIKKSIKQHIKYLQFLKLRKEKGFDENTQINIHSVFTGNPGTGKTTVVKMLGKIYNKLGILSIGHVHEVDRAILVGEFIGQTAPKTKKAIEEARGGILFIDEAYALFREKEDGKDYGREVIEILIKEMSDGQGDLAIMVAGYPKEMDIFLDSNPGLKSRFGYYFEFDDYTPDELIDIAELACKKRSVKMTPEAKKMVKKILTDAYRKRDKSFGNARFAYSIIDSAKMNMGIRLMNHAHPEKLTKTDLSTITEEDVKKILEKQRKKQVNISTDEELLASALNELDSLIGLTTVKNNVKDLIKLAKYYRETGRDVLNKFSLHSIFTGNPGTGKTTVARIMAKIYKALGLLERGHLIETDAEGLISGYVGQTATKTKHQIDNAMGGVLFIDEAYAITDGSNSSDFGDEAVEVLLKNMEDHRGKFAVIAAGYPDEMDKFLTSNPGLMSRFDHTLHFPDYSAEELFKIAEFMLKKENLYFNQEAAQFIKNYIDKLHKNRDKFFGNAREVRKIVEQIIKKQNLRMAETPSEQRTEHAIKTVILEDVKHFEVKHRKTGKTQIGFV